MTRGNRKQSHDSTAEGLSLGAQNTSLILNKNHPILNNTANLGTHAILVLDLQYNTYAMCIVGYSSHK